MKAAQIAIRISAVHWQELRNQIFTDDGNENAAVLVCSESANNGFITLLVREIVSASPAEYLVRESHHLEVSPRYYNRIIDRCLGTGTSVMIVHSHPHNDEAWYSKSDDYGESRLLPILQSLLPNSIVGSLVVSLKSVAGRWYADRQLRSLESVVITGNRASKTRLGMHEDESRRDGRFDRQIRAIGLGNQNLLNELKIAIVGVGGTGSLVAEQMARIGVQDVLLVDADMVEDSNVTRIFGSNASSIGKSKVRVAEEHLRRLGASKAKGIEGSVVSQHILMKLRDRDMCFGCVDNHLARSVLNRFAHQYLIPLVDMGIRIDAREGFVSSAAGRVSVVGAGMVCMRCSQHINAERVYAESLPENERSDLAREGYAMGIDDPVPSITSMNTTIAGLGVTACLNLFVNLTGDLQPLDQLYDAKSGVVFTANPAHVKNCDVCDPISGVVAIGDSQIVSAYDS